MTTPSSGAVSRARSSTHSRSSSPCASKKACNIGRRRASESATRFTSASRSRSRPGRSEAACWSAAPAVWRSPVSHARSARASATCASSVGRPATSASACSSTCRASSGAVQRPEQGDLAEEEVGLAGLELGARAEELQCARRVGGGRAPSPPSASAATSRAHARRKRLGCGKRAKARLTALSSSGSPSSIRSHSVTRVSRLRPYDAGEVAVGAGAAGAARCPGCPEEAEKASGRGVGAGRGGGPEAGGPRSVRRSGISP